MEYLQFTLTDFRLKCFIIMTSKSGFLWKLCYNITFYACKIIKRTSGINLKKTNFFARWRQHPKKSWNIFQIQITLLLWGPQDSQGCLEKQNHPLSSNLVVLCAKIGSKTEKLRKSVKKHFLMFFLTFMKFFELSCFWAKIQMFSTPCRSVTSLGLSFLKSLRLYLDG